MNPRGRAAILLIAGTAFLAALRADLPQVKAEPNLEKRARLALDNAESALKQAREAYDNGGLEDTASLLTEVGDSVTLADESLKQTGKDAGRSPKHFKHAELRTRELVRKLESFERQMNVADRGMIGPLKSKVQQIHDDLLDRIMRKH